MDTMTNRLGKVALRFVAVFIKAGFMFFQRGYSLKAEYQWRVERYKSRKQLLRLEDHLLRDIGVSRGDANLEANRDFWD